MNKLKYWMKHTDIQRWFPSMKPKLLFVAIKLHSQNLLEYRGDVIVWTFGTFIEPLIAMMIWLSVLSSGASLIFNKAEMLIYFMAMMVIHSMISSWSSWFIGEDIKSGEATKYLIKPMPMIYDHLAWNLSEKIYKIVITIITVGVITSLNFATLLTGNIKISVISVIFSILSLLMAMIIYFYMDQIVGIVTFWTHDNDFFRNFWAVFELLFSGAVIPFLFLPSLLKGIAFILPFRYAGGFPAEVLLNKLDLNSLLIGFLVQMVWVVMTVGGYFFLYKKGTKIYQGFGSLNI